MYSQLYWYIGKYYENTSLVFKSIWKYISYRVSTSSFAVGFFRSFNVLMYIITFKKGNKTKVFFKLFGLWYNFVSGYFQKTVFQGIHLG